VDIADAILVLGRAAFCEFTKNHPDSETVATTVENDAATEAETEAETEVETASEAETSDEEAPARIASAPVPKDTATRLLNTLMEAIASERVTNEKINTILPSIEALLASIA
jgi:hypothetical protein